jgi:hypothetical protein
MRFLAVVLFALFIAQSDALKKIGKKRDKKKVFFQKVKFLILSIKRKDREEGRKGCDEVSLSLLCRLKFCFDNLRFRVAPMVPGNSDGTT